MDNLKACIAAAEDELHREKAALEAERVLLAQERNALEAGKTLLAQEKASFAKEKEEHQKANKVVAGSFDPFVFFGTEGFPRAVGHRNFSSPR